jgi:hypothetical protein
MHPSHPSPGATASTSLLCSESGGGCDPGCTGSRSLETDLWGPWEPSLQMKTQQSQVKPSCFCLQIHALDPEQAPTPHTGERKGEGKAGQGEAGDPCTQLH